MKSKKTAGYIISVAIWLIIWQLLSLTVNLEMLLPSPFATVKAFLDLCKTGEFYLSILSSLLRITIGFIMGVFFGTVMGIATAFSSKTNIFFTPMFHIIKATPVASFIILAIVWLKSQNIPSFISMLMVIPFIWSNIKTGIANTDKSLLEMSDFFGVSFKNKFKSIYIPSVKPYFLSATTTAMGLAWKAGIAAEVLCYPEHSIGKGIYNSKIYILTPQLFAWTSVIIILSIILEKITLKLIRRISNDNA